MCQLLSDIFRHFEVTGKGEDSYKIFAVPDFVGDACKAIASRVRGAVAGVQFDDFHKVRAQKGTERMKLLPLPSPFLSPSLPLSSPFPPFFLLPFFLFDLPSPPS